ncbi:hypothetical protein ACFLV4_03125 [Chloroflexota bacterium]
MSKERVFTEEELKEMGGRTLDAIQAAIDDGDGEKARKLSRRMYNDFFYMHALYRDWTTALLTFVGRHYGDEALEQALRESCTAWLKPLVELYSKAELRRKVQMQANGLRGHLGLLRVEEDDEKFTFIMEPCGSGGRLILDGSYGSPQNFLMVKKGQPITYGREDFPVYCTHCSIVEILPVEWTGVPLFIVAPAEKLGEEPCRVYLYKDAKAIPQEYYRMVGKTKGQLD